MALQHPGDEDLLDYYVFNKIPVLVVLYEYPISIEACLQFMGEAAGLQLKVGDKQYKVLIASDGQHLENGKKDGVLLLTTRMFKERPVEVSEFATALTGGDEERLYVELKAMEDGLRVTYGGQGI